MKKTLRGLSNSGGLSECVMSDLFSGKATVETFRLSIGCVVTPAEAELQRALILF